MARGRRIFALFTFVLGACGGGDSETPPEVVVADASLGGAKPVLLGATTTAVTWTATSGSSTLVATAALATLPATGQQLATASGPVAHAGSFVMITADHALSRVSVDGGMQRIATVDPEALAASSDAPPVAAWSIGAAVSWGVDDAQMTVTLNRVDRCDHAVVTARSIYVAADGASGRRLIRIDQQTGTLTPVTSSSTWAAMFPGGGAAGATYRGRIAAADDAGALWLVEEMPSGRGIVVAEPVQGEASIVLEHLSHATGFFASAGALYWQEGDELLSAPRAGGPASIVATLPGPAGALADGYVYFTHGSAIERRRVE